MQNSKHVRGLRPRTTNLLTDIVLNPFPITCGLKLLKNYVQGYKQIFSTFQGIRSVEHEFVTENDFNLARIRYFTNRYSRFKPVGTISEQPVKHDSKRKITIETVVIHYYQNTNNHNRTKHNVHKVNKLCSVGIVSRAFCSTVSSIVIYAVFYRLSLLPAWQ
jgi:hypothetical protein